MSQKLTAGQAYKLERSNKYLANGHHANARGGYRDHKTTPIPKSEGKKYEVNRAIKPGTKIGNNSQQGNPRDQTKRDPIIPDKIAENESGTVGNGKNLLMIGGVVGLAALIYYYYR